MSDRVYSEREIAALLERAVERQEEARRRLEPEAGLTLAELERLGEEVGIAPEHLRAAALELDAGGAAGRQSGRSATHVYVERWLPGTLNPEAWEDAVATLQERFGGGGGSGVQQVGRSHEWSHADAFGFETRVIVSERGDRVRLRLSQKLGHFRSAVEGPLYGALATFVLVLPFATAAAGSAALAVAIALAAFILLSGLIYVGDRRWRDKKHRELEAMADDLGARLVMPPTAERASIEAPAAALPSPEVPALDLDALGEAPEAEPVAPGRSRMRS
ncbi:MAG TPA: hypothetical protein VD962_00535 [Rubricoccaceae bacterium]|nr:hypothetical protein [Rubricoccaceae bacterium]